MRIRIEHLRVAERDKILATGQADALWRNIGTQLSDEPAFKMQHLVYYFGAMLLILPFSLVVGPAILAMQKGALFIIATAMAIGSFMLADWLKKRTWRIPAGIFGCLTVALTPLCVYLALASFGVDFNRDYRAFHQFIDARWVSIEVITLAVSCAALWRIREPFMVLPVAVLLWYLGLDLSQGMTGHKTTDMSVARIYSMFFGLALLCFAFCIEQRTRHTLRDFSFWLWIFGAISFWGPLSMDSTGIEWKAAAYGVINIGMIVAGGLLGRRVLAVFGALGSAGYLWHLTDKVFAGSVAFPFVVMALGAGLVWAATQWPHLEAQASMRFGFGGRRDTAQKSQPNP